MVEFAVIQPGKRLERVGCAFGLIHPHIIAAADQTSFHAAEQHRDSVRLHGGGLRDGFFCFVEHIHKQQTVFFAVDLTGLIEFAAGNADIIPFRRLRQIDFFFIGQLHVIHPAKAA